MERMPGEERPIERRPESGPLGNSANIHLRSPSRAWVVAPAGFKNRRAYVGKYKEPAPPKSEAPELKPHLNVILSTGIPDRHYVALSPAGN
jgi:hypothetical protein